MEDALNKFVGKFRTTNFQSLGCFKTWPHNPFSLTPGSGYDQEGCKNAAQRVGSEYKYFALLNSRCYYGDEETDYAKNGKSWRCKNGLGGDWSNSVYKIGDDITWEFARKFENSTLGDYAKRISPGVIFAKMTDTATGKVDYFTWYQDCEDYNTIKASRWNFPKSLKKQPDGSTFIPSFRHLDDTRYVAFDGHMTQVWTKD